MICRSNYFSESHPTEWLSDAKRETMPNQHPQLKNNNWKR